MEEIEQIKLIVDALEAKKAKDVVVLDLRQQSSYLTYFVIATALSRVHLKTLFNEIHNTAVAHGIERTRAQSPQYESGWVTYDLGFYIVHLFEEEKRKFYNLENIWKAAVQVDFTKKRINDLTPRKGETERQKPLKKVSTKQAKKTSEKAKSFSKKKTTIKKKIVKEKTMATAKKKPAKKAAKKTVKKAKKTTKKK